MTLHINQDRHKEINGQYLCGVHNLELSCPMKVNMTNSTLFGGISSMSGIQTGDYTFKNILVNLSGLACESNGFKTACPASNPYTYDSEFESGIFCCEVPHDRNDTPTSSSYHHNCPASQSLNCTVPPCKDGPMRVAEPQGSKWYDNSSVIYCAVAALIFTIVVCVFCCRKNKTEFKDAYRNQAYGESDGTL